LTIDEAVFESERRTGHRNRAIAHLLLNFGHNDLQLVFRHSTRARLSNARARTAVTSGEREL
jgi:glutaminase